MSVDIVGGGKHCSFGLKAKGDKVTIVSGNPHKPRTQGLYAAKHKGIVHISVGTTAFKIYKPRLGSSVKFLAKGGNCRFCQNVRKAGLRQKMPEAAVKAIQAFTYSGGADGRFFAKLRITEAGKFDNLHAGSGQNLFHNGVVAGRKGILGLTSNKAHGSAKSRSNMPCKYINVKAHLGFRCV